MVGISLGCAADGWVKWKYSNLHTASPRLISLPTLPDADIVTTDKTMLCSFLALRVAA